MIPAWAYIAFTSALLTSLRHIHIKNKCSRYPLVDKHVILQALFWVGGYSCQIFAIGAAFGVQSGTTYVKALTLANVLSTTVFGGALFKKKDLLRKGLATFLMICGSILIVLAT